MHLTLIVPGLVPDGPGAASSLRACAPGLRRLLMRAQRRAGVQSFEADLFARFGWAGTGEPPLAAVTAVADGLTSEGYWLRADPVHLRAELHGVTLFGFSHAAPTAEEARALATAFDRIYAEEGLKLLTPAAARWYLHLPNAPALATTPLPAALGRDIRTLLPGGAEAAAWNARLTEVQMLFYGETVNLAREARREPIINGLWFWGGGAAPQGLRPPPDEIYANDPLTRGLVRLAGGAINPLPGGAHDLFAAAAGEAAVLVVLDGLHEALAVQDVDGWCAGVEGLERDWFTPALEALRRGTLQAVSIVVPSAGSFHCARIDLLRFWRRHPAAERLFG